MSKKLLIVFVKNTKLGTVKTRLAKSIGDAAALKIYSALVRHTKHVSNSMTMDTHVYFSTNNGAEKWNNASINIQVGSDLGERMSDAFKKGFDQGYSQIILIGSDLPDISNVIIEKGFDALLDNTVVFGPAKDGGYYLVGMNEFQSCIFENKSWSTSKLLEETLIELHDNHTKTALIDILNDIDTFEDLKTFPKFLKLISK
ncbi:TIGR04282 family arsenosugar biosynthesis glycosyltransferase [Flavobacteriaceae bacterium]|nr:TIGR04282 family arsenosugar biosynthesis glycosyltransferase [Flavobacteriaceae bacterium]MDC3242737.1 TIGR04282 family arsenosugar biosynthesis glycosyltransferase [Flavobacteriaceae bacterium]